jgi:hypothetical protein
LKFIKVKDQHDAMLGFDWSDKGEDNLFSFDGKGGTLANTDDD